jgi:hypothetical protein
MQGTSNNCSKVALACSGTMLVGLASDGIDAQPSILQVNFPSTTKTNPILFLFFFFF